MRALFYAEHIKETMDFGITNMFEELPAVFHESALIERFHGFIKGGISSHE